jgi:hypothetical protein
VIEMLSDIVASLAWSALGFVAGYVVGAMRVEVHEIKETVCEHPDHEHKEASQLGTRERGDLTMPKRLLHKNFTVNVLVGGLIILLAVYTTITGAINSARDEEQARCFTNYNLQFIEAYQARARAADQDRNSFSKLILSLEDPDAADRRAAFSKYVEEVRDTDAQRRNTPLPEPPNPEQFCTRR